MKKSNSPSTTLNRFFAGLAEYTFQTRLGVVDPPLIDYVSDLLSRFVRCDAIHKTRRLDGQPIQEVAEMVWEAENRVGDARRALHRHIGDFTLFWTGLYPEAVRTMTAADKKDQFVDYCAQGKRAYFIASTIETDSSEEASSDVLERLSLQFEMCAYGLREVRREWERREEDGDAPQPLLFG